MFNSVEERTLPPVQCAAAIVDFEKTVPGDLVN